MRVGGANGVDLFFVISGFVMLHTQKNKLRTPYEFFKNRVIRIAPIYWAITIFVSLLFFAFPAIFRETIVTPTWVFSSLFFMSSIFSGKTPIVYVGWTLEWELFFYLMFAAGLFFKPLIFQVFFIVISVFFVSVFSGNWISIEFLFGMLVAGIYDYRRPQKYQGVLALILGAALLLLSISPEVNKIDINRVLLWGVPSFFIVYGLVCCGQVEGRMVAYFGDASYSIYLVQILTIPAFYKFSSRYLGDWNGDIAALACLIFSVTVGCVTYSLLEKKFTVMARRLLNS